MAGSVNKVILIGNLGRDPEVKHSRDGKPIVNLSIATSESWKDRSSGERKERVEWHRVVVFNEHLADVAQKYLKKGAKVYIEGQLQTRKWQDQSGTDRYATEVVLANFRGELTMLDGRRDGGGASSDDGDGYSSGAYSAASRGEGRPITVGGGTPVPGGDFDDEVPF